MKKTGIVLIAVLALVSCQKKNVIELNTENVPDNTKVEVFSVKLGELDPKVIASGVITKGQLIVDNPFLEADEVFLSISESDEVKHNIFLIGEPGAITIKFDQKNSGNYRVGGTENNDILQKFFDEMRPITTKLEKFFEEKGEKMTTLSESNLEQATELKKIKEEYNELSTISSKVVEKYESENRDKPIGLMMFKEVISSLGKPIAEYKEDFKKNYSEDAKKSLLGKKVEERLEFITEIETAQEEGPQIGDVLPEFKGRTVDGEELNLTTYLKDKKVVLVDVWASWCGPCRAENPNLVKTYEAFHKRGFDIIGYSLDKDDASWKKAIEADKLTWTQVSNLKFWQDPIVEDYGICGVSARPTTYFIC